MRYLLDTHTFLWAAFSPDKLSKAAVDAIMDPVNDISISSISFWEISLKSALGKMELLGVTPEQLPVAAEEMGFDLMSMNADEAATFYRLPRAGHNDPFDRMLVWQAICRRMILISKDDALNTYIKDGLALLW